MPISLPRSITGCRRLYTGPPFNPRGGYLAFLGRISPEKRVDRAIEIARTFGMPLKIAAKVDKVDEAYFRNGSPSDRAARRRVHRRDQRARKNAFLGEARALLFPIDWPEPFGLAMIEAMACGTPILAFRRGSVPEVIDEGVTGITVATMDEAIRQLPHVLALDRRAVRRRFEERFSATRMASVRRFIPQAARAAFGRDRHQQAASGGSRGWRKVSTDGEFIGGRSRDGAGGR